MKSHFTSSLQRPLPLIVATFFALGLPSKIRAAEPVKTPPQARVPQPPQIGETAPDFELTAIDGTKVKLSAQTSTGPVVLVELRGFPGYQCPICTAQVGKLIKNAMLFSRANARVLLVYPGPAEGLKARADEFASGKGIPKNFSLLLDPDFVMTKKYGLRWDAKGETSYPSTFVLDTQRKVLFAKVSRSHGDRATTEEILAALPKPSSKP